MRRAPTAVGLALALASLAGCVRHARDDARRTYGSCEAACDHYLECRRSEDPTLAAGCLTECRDIFVSRGEPDQDSLREFESLACHDTIAFVEGRSGRRPGESATSGDAPSSRAAPPDRGDDRPR